MWKIYANYYFILIYTHTCCCKSRKSFNLNLAQVLTNFNLALVALFLKVMKIFDLIFHDLSSTDLILEWFKFYLFELFLEHLINFPLNFRYKYLEKMHEEEMSKILVYLNGFTDDERLRLAQITALWLASGQIPATTLRVLINVSNYY